MRRHASGVTVAELTEVLPCPEVAHQRTTREVIGDLSLDSVAIEQRHRAGAVNEIAPPHLGLAGASDTRSLLSERILVDGNDLAGGQHASYRLAHRPNVVARHEPRGPDRPAPEV